MELLRQLADSGAWIEFTQGLDARFMTVEVAEALNFIKRKVTHFAFDFMKNVSVVLSKYEAKHIFLVCSLLSLLENH